MHKAAQSLEMADSLGRAGPSQLFRFSNTVFVSADGHEPVAINLEQLTPTSLSRVVSVSQNKTGLSLTAENVLIIGLKKKNRISCLLCIIWKYETPP